jgi:LysM repeat protein
MMKKKLLLSTLLSLFLLQGTSYAASYDYDQYTVKDGDTFWSIAQQAGVNVADLTAINPLVDQNNIYHGYFLNLPNRHKPMEGVTPPVTNKTYTVQGDDTFWSISQHFGIDLSHLITANPQVADPGNIYPGLVLNIPIAPESIPSTADTQNKLDYIIELAKDQLGTPYVWGGSAPWVSLDCSGLTQYVYGKLGIYLPHHAADQFNYGTPVAANQLREGDLVFFKEHGSPTITHVGIYLGNDQMINADTDPKNGVQIENIFSDAYYSSCYAGAIRLVK